mmetsp:Transcript_6914/g.17800  ORF Transcript_6914/g.17800 Transcript_6914/m.17800 type:complete len:245 (-) Transcript_6914:197-931(-)
MPLSRRHRRDVDISRNFGPCVKLLSKPFLEPREHRASAGHEDKLRQSSHRATLAVGIAHLNNIPQHLGKPLAAASRECRLKQGLCAPDVLRLELDLGAVRECVPWRFCRLGPKSKRFGGIVLRNAAVLPHDTVCNRVALCPLQLNPAVVKQLDNVSGKVISPQFELPDCVRKGKPFVDCHGMRDAIPYIDDQPRCPAGRIQRENRLRANKVGWSLKFLKQELRHPCAVLVQRGGRVGKEDRGTL